MLREPELEARLGTRYAIVDPNSEKSGFNSHFFVTPTGEVIFPGKKDSRVQKANALKHKTLIEAVAATLREVP